MPARSSLRLAMFAVYFSLAALAATIVCEVLG